MQKYDMQIHYAKYDNGKENLRIGIDHMGMFWESDLRNIVNGVGLEMFPYHVQQAPAYIFKKALDKLLIYKLLKSRCSSKK